MPKTKKTTETGSISRTYRVSLETDKILKKKRKELNISEAKVIDLMAKHFKNAKLQLILE